MNIKWANLGKKNHIRQQSILADVLCAREKGKTRKREKKQTCKRQCEVIDYADIREYK